MPIETAASTASIAVIIAVRNGAPWIARSIGSALAQPETGQVYVVDDGSTDGTFDVARGCDDGTGRLVVDRLESNRGPSIARNWALDRITLPFVSILDADDFMLPGRFTRMLSLAGTDWDLVADDLILVPTSLINSDDPLHEQFTSMVEQQGEAPTLVSPEVFIRGNISREGRMRRELGFLKPIVRRSLLEELHLRYRADVRLGEDYLLYTEALLAGARFKIVKPCGYIAVQRPDSLSGHHAAAEHARMVALDTELIAKVGKRPSVVAAIEEHRAHSLIKFQHRQILEMGKARGRIGALLGLIQHPRAAPQVLREALKTRISRVMRLSPRLKIQFLIGPGDKPS